MTRANPICCRKGAHVWAWLTGKQKPDRVRILQKIMLKHQLALARTLETRFNILNTRLCDLLLRLGPGPVGLTILGEDTMADEILFRVTLPAISAPDVVRREISLSINGVDSAPLFIDALGTTATDTLRGPQNATVVVSLIDVDDAGNRSQASSGTFVLLDVVAPPAPGSLGIEVLGEEHVVTPPSDAGHQAGPDVG